MVCCFCCRNCYNYSAVQTFIFLRWTPDWRCPYFEGAYQRVGINVCVSFLCKAVDGLIYVVLCELLLVFNFYVHNRQISCTPFQHPLHAVPFFIDCRGATLSYINTSTCRPGFDEFLHRLRSCGLRYRLKRMSDILPAVLLEEIRRNTPVTVVGGPVMRPLDGGGGVSGTEDGGGGGGAGKVQGGAPARAVTPTAGFDEFVLCSVFRGGEITT